MGLVIFVGGATASGKSTFVQELNERIDGSKKYRRYQGFYDIATNKKIPDDQIFKQVSSESVDNWFVDICKSSTCIISDVHYAVQMNRNSSASSENIDIYQEYVPTVSETLLQRLITEGISIVAIYINCSPNTCLNRATNRYNSQQKELRSQSLLDAQLENDAEKREWNTMSSLVGIKRLELDSESYSPLELVSQCLEFLNTGLEKNKSYCLLKRDRGHL